MDIPNNTSGTSTDGDGAGVAPKPADQSFLDVLDQEIENGGGEWEEHPAYIGSVGRTMFDLPNSKDNLVSVLLPKESSQALPSQTLVLIGHPDYGDRRVYQGIIVQGPFYEPDGLRGDAPLIVTTTVRGATFMPRYHGRVEVEILGEIVGDTVLPPRYRPQPNSPVFALGQEETAAALKIDGDITLGVAIGHENMEVSFPSDKKSVLPRHTAILGTTGGGKSTTVANQINELHQAGVATILIDTEGEYTHINDPTTHGPMLKALERRGKTPHGVTDTYVYHLVGRETSNPRHPNRPIAFTLPFDRLSPYMAMEILELNEAQQQRYLKAYDLAKNLLNRLRIFPADNDDRNQLLELDELEQGYPKLTLQMMYEVVRACASRVAKELRDENNNISFTLRTLPFRNDLDTFLQIIEGADLPSHVWSWRTVQGRLSQLLRLGIFDSTRAQRLNYDALTTPGRVSIIDLGDTDSPQINNLVIAELLRGVQEQQNENYRRAQTRGEGQRRVVVLIEEAHEFLSAARIRQMPVLFQQVAKIAKRGRKRWLGLTFVTQLPQHLPDEVLGLVNNFILHKITDAHVISRLKRIAGGIDDGLWQRLPTLAAGQAIVKMESMARPLLVAMDPAPCKLLMVD